MDSSIRPKSRDVTAHNVHWRVDHDEARVGLPFTLDLSEIDGNAAIVGDEVKALYSADNLPDSNVEKDDVDKEIHWKNPRTQMVIRLNSRTGSMIETRKIATTGRIEHFVQPRVNNQLLDHYNVNDSFEVSESSIYSISPSITTKNISGKDLANAKIIGQIDSKFILVAMENEDHSESLFLIDQHAADERVKVEELYQDLFRSEKIILKNPIIFELEDSEVSLIRQHQQYFTSWNIIIEMSSKSTIKVLALPKLIAERCRLEPKIVIDMIRKEIWSEDCYKTLIRNTSREDSITSWLSNITSCPKTIIELLQSRACRSSIMFNDILTHEQCFKLLENLSKCIFPLQCAHGRPSITTLMRLSGYETRLDENNAQFKRPGIHGNNP